METSSRAAALAAGDSPEVPGIVADLASAVMEKSTNRRYRCAAARRVKTREAAAVPEGADIPSTPPRRSLAAKVSTCKDPVPCNKDLDDRANSQPSACAGLSNPDAKIDRFEDVDFCRILVVEFWEDQWKRKRPYTQSIFDEANWLVSNLHPSLWDRLSGVSLRKPTILRRCKSFARLLAHDFMSDFYHSLDHGTEVFDDAPLSALLRWLQETKTYGDDHTRPFHTELVELAGAFELDVEDISDLSMEELVCDVAIRTWHNLNGSSVCPVDQQYALLKTVCQNATVTMLKAWKSRRTRKDYHFGDYDALVIRLAGFNVNAVGFGVKTS